MPKQLPSPFQTHFIGQFFTLYASRSKTHTQGFRNPPYQHRHDCSAALRAKAGGQWEQWAGALCWARGEGCWARGAGRRLRPTAAWALVCGWNAGKFLPLSASQHSSTASSTGGPETPPKHTHIHTQTNKHSHWHTHHPHLSFSSLHRHRHTPTQTHIYYLYVYVYSYYSNITLLFFFHRSTWGWVFLGVYNPLFCPLLCSLSANVSCAFPSPRKSRRGWW